MSKTTPVQDDAEQSKRFEHDARELGMDETGAAFKRVMTVVVPPKAATAARAKKPAKKAGGG